MVLMFGAGAGSDICGGGALTAGASGSAGGCGKYSGPVWPQALKVPARTTTLKIRMGRGK
jgi:hypothetical protein